MTPSQALALKPVFDAYAEGRGVQWRATVCGGERIPDAAWHDYDGVSPHLLLPCDGAFGTRGRWEWEWRIKPEPPKPREWWLVGNKNYPTEPYSVWSSRPSKPHEVLEVIHVREVVG